MTMNPTSLQLHRAAGSLLASAAGDALGAGYEFTHPTSDTEIGMIGGGLGNFAPGEWTDDTSMTVAIAEVTASGIDLRTPAGLDAVAANFVRWYDSSPPDIGNQTAAVLRSRPTSAAAMAAAAAAIEGRKGGNGSLMRTAPLGFAFLGDQAATTEAAAAVALLTHDDPVAVQACQLWSLLIEHAVRTGDLDREWSVLGRLDDDAVEYWTARKLEAESGSPADFPNNGWVVHALQTAWWAIVTSDDSGPQQVQDALERAVRAGHDTDTTAAIAGALIGAVWGVSAVPAAWRRMLHGWPGLDANDLVRLAVQTGSGSDSAAEWPGVERMSYTGLSTGNVTRHPHDDGLLIGGHDAVAAGGYDAVVSLCQMGRAETDREHLQIWLIDRTPAHNPNLEFVLDDTARMIKQLRSEGKRVLLHCVEGRSRTPSVAARYSILLGRNPQDVLDAMPWAAPQDWLWQASVSALSTLVEACTRWQTGRDGGSSLLRGAARVLRAVRHYFSASYITDYEDRAAADPIVMAEGAALLRAVENAEQLDADGWNDRTGLPARGFAGRGLAAKPAEDAQIAEALAGGTITMPLWGVSLNPEVAQSFGNGALRWLLEIVGPFPAVPTWTLSGIKADEQELICGGRFAVDAVVDHGSHTQVRLRYLDAAH